MRVNWQQLLGNWVIRGMLGMSLLAAGAIVAPAQGWYRRPPYGDSYREPYRGGSPVDLTINHLQHVSMRSSYYASGRERSRIDNAMRHLSEFQDRLSRGRFDKGKLDQAIGDVQNVVDHNPLNDRSRSELWNDLNSLRAFRASRGGYGDGYYGGPRY